MVHNLVFGLNRSARIGTMSDQEDHSEDKHIDSEEDMDNEEEEDLDNLDANKSEEEEEEEEDEEEVAEEINVAVPSGAAVAAAAEEEEAEEEAAEEALMVVQIDGKLQEQLRVEWGCWVVVTQGDAGGHHEADPEGRAAAEADDARRHQGGLHGAARDLHERGGVRVHAGGGEESVAGGQGRGEAVRDHAADNDAGGAGASAGLQGTRTRRHGALQRQGALLARRSRHLGRCGGLLQGQLPLLRGHGYLRGRAAAGLQRHLHQAHGRKER